MRTLPVPSPDLSVTFTKMILRLKRVSEVKSHWLHLCSIIRERLMRTLPVSSPDLSVIDV